MFTLHLAGVCYFQYSRLDYFHAFTDNRDPLAGSVVSENELDDLTLWHIRDNIRELARIVIKPPYQSKGYGKHLINMLCLRVKHHGANAIHLLVSTENHHALNLYRETGFQNRGQCHRYDLDFYAFEKKL